MPSEASGAYHLVADPPVGQEYEEALSALEGMDMTLQPPKSSSEMADYLNSLVDAEQGAQGSGGGYGENDEGGDVYDCRRVVPFGVDKGIGEQQAAFSIGADDLDGLSVAGGDYVLGTIGVPTNHVFYGGDQADDM